MSRLALVLATDPSLGDLDAICDLAAAARRAEHAVELFVMGPAVRVLVDETPRIDELVDSGCDIVACAVSVHRAAIDEDSIGVPTGSQDDHAAMMSRADRCLAFT